MRDAIVGSRGTGPGPRRTVDEGPRRRIGFQHLRRRWETRPSLEQVATHMELSPGKMKVHSAFQASLRTRRSASQLIN